MNEWLLIALAFVSVYFTLFLAFRKAWVLSALAASVGIVCVRVANEATWNIAWVLGLIVAIAAIWFIPRAFTVALVAAMLVLVLAAFGPFNPGAWWDSGAAPTATTAESGQSEAQANDSSASLIERLLDECRTNEDLSAADLEACANIIAQDAEDQGMSEGAHSRSNPNGVECPVLDGCVFFGGLKGPNAEAKFADLTAKTSLSPTAQEFFAKLIQQELGEDYDPPTGELKKAQYNLGVVLHFFGGAEVSLVTVKAGTKVMNSGRNASGEVAMFADVLKEDREALKICKDVDGKRRCIKVFTTCGNGMVVGKPPEGVPICKYKCGPPPGGKDSSQDVSHSDEAKDRGLDQCGTSGCGKKTKDKADYSAGPGEHDPEDSCKGSCKPEPKPTPTDPPPDEDHDDDDPVTEDPPPDDGP